MLPARSNLPHGLQTLPAFWRAGSAALALALCSGVSAYAQTADDSPPQTQADATSQVKFEADRVEYHDRDDLVIASGNVVLRRGEQSVIADKVTWNANSGQILATGNIRMVDENGNQVFTDSVELTDEFKTGTMTNLLLALREGGRMAALRGSRDGQGRITLEQASYSACAIEDTAGCPKKPSWRVTANRVDYDPALQSVRFSGARLELFGVPLLPLPGLKIMSDGRATSGVLTPDLSFSPSNGAEVSTGWYWRMADNRDLTATLHTYTRAAPMGQIQYRQLSKKGAVQITGYATRSQRVPIDTSGRPARRDWRGYIATNGRYQFDPHWSATFSIRRASDRTLLRRYDISRDDRLRSMIDVERIGDKSYLSMAGWSTQTLRIGAPQGQVPIALPVIDYRRRIDDPFLGGKIELQANTLAITRTAGQDTQRAFAGARWNLRRLTGMGQEITLTGLVRGDVYHSDENELTVTPSYRGLPGWHARAVATAAVDVKWPLIGPLFGGTQVLTPRIQIVASPKIRNLDMPNEDARAIDLEDSNLFALNRFPGYDRIEDGQRITYGLEWQLEIPRWRFRTTVGQSYRLTSKPSLLPEGTGLTGRVSDIVGRSELRYRDFLKLTHRFRLDKDSLAMRRNEFDATVGSARTYAEIGYLKLDRNAPVDLEDLQDREELRLAGRYAFAKYWSVFGSGVFNLTDRAEDPTNTSDGFDPLRTRLGIAYQDDCLELALTWRRDYRVTGDARKGNSFLVSFSLRNLGLR